MTKNIIGLPIVGSLCYISVGLVKSIVWMSAIRTMDVCNSWLFGAPSTTRHLCRRLQPPTADATGFLPATLASAPLCGSAFVIFTAWIPLIKTINFTNLAKATKKLSSPDKKE